jgi:hypothetical protein
VSRLPQVELDHGGKSQIRVPRPVCSLNSRTAACRAAFPLLACSAGKFPVPPLGAPHHQHGVRTRDMPIHSGFAEAVSRLDQLMDGAGLEC